MKPKAWQNWSGSVKFQPQNIRQVKSQAEIEQTVAECVRQGKSLRVAGAGHSFTPLLQTDGTLMLLNKYSGVISADRAKMQATVKAGTRLKLLGEELHSLGMAMPNLGDIDAQTISGALSTGTHGTGATLGTLSTQAVGYTIVTSSGDTIECSATQNANIYKAAQVSLGALGVISRVTLQLQPAYKLEYTWRPEPLSQILANLEQYTGSNRHFEFYFFPYGETALAKFSNLTEDAPTGKNLLRKANDLLIENASFWALCEVARLRPIASANIARLCSKLLTGGRAVDFSHRVFATARLVRFQEMEYSLPAQNALLALNEIRECIEREQFQVMFPLECRFVKGDDIPLSPATGRDSVYIAAHQYRGTPYQAYFAALEQILLKHGGRPHWGKHHTLSSAELRGLYPQWEQFQAVRRQLDPQGIFLNPHLHHLFDEQPAPLPAVVH